MRKDFFDDFDRDFDRQFNSIKRRATFMMGFGVLWMIFLMSCVGFWTFMLGRWTGIW